MRNKQHKGQVALVLVLIMTVVSALAVSLASRSTTDTRIQQTESEGVQALLFAQTGIEQLIANPDNTTGDNYTASISDVGGSSWEVGKIDSGSSVELNLVGADTQNPNGFVVYWGPAAENPNDQPSLFISVIENTGKIVDYAYGYTSDNNFSIGSVVSGKYPRATSIIPISSASVKARVMVLGSSALVKIEPSGGSGAVFPPQIKSIRSVGTVNSDTKTVKYGLQYDESASDTVPGVFDYSLFSGGSIVQ